MSESLTGSYFQWRRTEVMEVRCEIIVAGWYWLSNKSKHYLLKCFEHTLKTLSPLFLQYATKRFQWPSYTTTEDSLSDWVIHSAMRRLWPFFLKMALKVSTHEDLRAGNASFPCHLLEEWPLARQEEAHPQPVELVVTETLRAGPASTMLTASLVLPRWPWGCGTPGSYWGPPAASWMVGRRTLFPSLTTGPTSHRHIWPSGSGMVMHRRAACCS